MKKNFNNEDENILEDVSENINDDFDEEELGDYEESSEYQEAKEELDEFFDEFDPQAEKHEKYMKDKKRRIKQDRLDKQRQEELQRQQAINNEYNKNPQYSQQEYNNPQYENPSYDNPDYLNHDEYNSGNVYDNQYNEPSFNNDNHYENPQYSNNSFSPNQDEIDKLREKAVNERIRIQEEEQTYENRRRDGSYYNEETGKFYKDGMETSQSNILNEQKREEKRQQKEFENQQFRENYAEKLKKDYEDYRNSDDKGFGNAHIDLTAKQNHADDHSLEIDSFKTDNEQSFGTGTGLKSTVGGFDTENASTRYVSGKNNYMSGRDFNMANSNKNHTPKDAFNGAKMIKDQSTFKTPVKSALDNSDFKAKSKINSSIATPVNDTFINKAAKTQEFKNIGVAVGTYAQRIGQQLGGVMASGMQDDDTAEGMRRVRTVAQPIAQQIGIASANAHYKVQMNSLRSKDMTQVKSILMKNKKNAEQINTFNLMNFNTRKDVADTKKMIVDEFKRRGMNISRMSNATIKKQIAKLKGMKGKEDEIALLTGLLDINKADKAGRMSMGKIKNLKNILRRASFAMIEMADNSDVWWKSCWKYIKDS